MTSQPVIKPSWIPKQSQEQLKRWFPNPAADRHEDLYQALIDAQAAVEQGTATPEDRELALAWDHAARFAAAANRYCPGLGETFLREYRWIRP